MMVEIFAELNTGESGEGPYSLFEKFVARLTGEQTTYQMIELVHQVKLAGNLQATKPAIWSTADS